MSEIRNNRAAIIGCEIILRHTEARIEAIEERLLSEKMTNSKFMQLCDERGALMMKRRTAIKKLQYARKGKNPWGEAEAMMSWERHLQLIRADL